jgi:hypothetical protein
MSTSSLFQILLNDGKHDMMNIASIFLQERLEKIKLNVPFYEMDIEKMDVGCANNLIDAGAEYEEKIDDEIIDIEYVIANMHI